MSEYPSILNLYKSNGEQNAGRRRGPEFGLSREEFGSVSRWLVTEKVDGTNVRVTLWPEGLLADGLPALFGQDAPARVALAGRTDRAQLHPQLLAYLEKTFTLEKVQAALRDEEGELPTSPVVLYGEGYGAGIQKAGIAYGPDKRFILFDVRVGATWLLWDDVVDVARKLEIPHVPLLTVARDLETCKAHVRTSVLIPDDLPGYVEGVVCRAEPPLFDRFGNRVMFKYKVRDL